MADHLSSIETLPETATVAMQSAFDAIQSRRATQKQILAKLNSELVRIGIEPITMSSFNRYVGRVRSGELTRPVSIATPASSGAVLNGAFRSRLIGAIGEAATLQMEAALVALACRRDG